MRHDYFQCSGERGAVRGCLGDATVLRRVNLNMPRFRRCAFALLAVASIVSVNMSRFAPRPPAPWHFLAHRGVHQTFALDGVNDDTCTATRIAAPTHPFIENTLSAMRAAFEAGAEEIELDVHFSKDGVPMVFHDVTLDCRTNGTGAVEDHTVSELRSLDVGWGYTHDNGRTFPLRGTGIGLMPTLDAVFAEFSNRRLLIHFKTNRASDGDLVADRLARLSPTNRALISVYGGDVPSARVQSRLPEVRAFTKQTVKTCLIEYGLVGWIGIMPCSCHNTRVVVPIDVATKLWGWPRRFEARLAAVGTDIILVGRGGEGHSIGMDDDALLAQVPDDFGGRVWTDQIETTSTKQASAKQRDSQQKGTCGP